MRNISILIEMMKHHFIMDGYTSLGFKFWDWDKIHFFGPTLY